MVTADTKNFLADRGHGVLAFNTDNPYALPVSYGYDVETERCFLQLYFGDESKKREHLNKSDGVCLVVYEWNDLSDWRSVVIIGRLKPVAPDDEVLSAEIFTEGASFTDMSVFADSINEMDIGWYELVVETIQGREPTGDLF